MTTTSEAPGIPALSKPQFVALMAMLMAINALSIDIMLPGLQEIGASLGVVDENARQYVITAYLIGMGCAQLFFGPLSDRFGRKLPLLGGLGIYALCALAIVFVPSFTGLLVLRFVQGIGAAATRVITVSIVRDIYGGRMMAEIMSLVLMVFMIVPVIAPSIGQLIMIFAEWHMIFVVICLFAILVATLVMLRLPETLAIENRRPFTVKSILGAFRIVLTNRVALCYSLAASFVFGSLFGFINSAQQIFVGVFGLGPWFPLAFAGFAGLMAIASFTNSRLVKLYGMRRLSHGALIGFVLASFAWAMTSIFGTLPFWLFAVLYGLAMFQFGLIGANFNAMAMEPLGHVAGTASSVLGFTQTIGGALIGALIGQAFDGTVTPLAIGFLTVSIVGLIFVLIAEKGRLFSPHNPSI
ncbi:multidrug effflux MFS transporter [Rhizobium sp. Root482]|jgi:DHA1 family bicyclomycin/chloramphenicol resistance-like MFS transporter|uniref:multidrug effflux MFS transporter n=1 Tax=Rhizobium sp. Root482 TaxID=1736543 RepID=UPI0007016A7E|nr:multidrug effflux MFS transporter [Rhizobium sp. Root482]KQY14493.1 MFS transporter [Rhizobium sp. Root482]